MSEVSVRKIAMIGFGEVGEIFGADLVQAGIRVSIFDKRMREQQSGETMFTKASRLRLEANESDDMGIPDSDIVISLVTASAAVDVAKSAAGYLHPGQIYLDLTSVSPESKRTIASEIARSGADFVEGAVMAPVKPQRLRVPILLGGPRAADLGTKLQSLGMDTKAVSDNFGVASAIKMCRSIVMKGIAALAIESLFAARRYGAEESVLASFDATYPAMGWKGNLADGLVRRAIEHSRRRAAEMREVANTLREAGLEPRMALATAETQDWLTEEMDAGHFSYREDEPFSWQAIADAIDCAARMPQG